MFYRTQPPNLGIQEIDKQHQELVVWLDRLVMWGGRGRGFPASLDILRGLSGSIEYHFQYEESFLRAHGYPDLQEHIAIHAEISSAVSRLLQQVKGGEDVSGAELESLREGFVDHIRFEDREYAAFVQFGGVSYCHGGNDIEGHRGWSKAV